MQRLKNGFIKSFISVFLAFVIIVLSLFDSFGRVSLMPVRRTDAFAISVSAILAGGIATLASGYSIYQAANYLPEIVSDILSGSNSSEDWQKVLEEEGLITVTDDMVADMEAYLEAKKAAWNGNCCTIDMGQNAQGWLMDKCPEAALALSVAGYSDELASYRRFWLNSGSCYDPDKLFNGTGSGYFHICPIADDVVGIILDGTNLKHVLSDGTIGVSSTKTSGIRVYFAPDSGWAGKEFTTDYSSFYLGTVSYHSCTYSDTDGLVVSSSQTSHIWKYICGVPVWLSAESYANGDDPVASYPEYGLPYGIDCMPVEMGQTFHDTFIGKSIPEGFGLDSLSDIFSRSFARGKAAYDDAIDSGKTETEAQEAAKASASTAANEAIDEINDKLGDSTSGIMGLLSSILAALTGSGLFALIKSFYEAFTGFMSKVLDGSIFADIIAAIKALPASIINAIEAVPDSIGNIITSTLTALGLKNLADSIGTVMQTVLTTLGLEDIFGRAIDGALDWVKDIPGTLSGAIDSALDWVKDIPGTLSGAIDSALDWVKDIPGSLAGAIDSALDWVKDIPDKMAISINNALDWILDIPQTIADAISDALEWLQDLVISIPGIADILAWLVLDVAAVTAALARVRALVLEKVGLPFVENPFIPFLGDLPEEYPVISIPLPKILKPYADKLIRNLNEDGELILIDFSQFASYCHTCRTIMQFLLWFSFVIYLIKSHKVDISIS